MSVHDLNKPLPEGGSPSGGCAIACAIAFVLVSLVWPILLVVCGGYDPPESLILPFLLGGPSFVLAHITAIIAWRSRCSWGKRALWIVWGAIALVSVAAFADYLIEGNRTPEIHDYEIHESYR